MGGIEPYLNMAYDYQHEPTKCDAGVHIAEHFISLEDIYMEKTVIKYIFYRFEKTLGDE